MRSTLLIALPLLLAAPLPAAAQPGDTPLTVVLASYSFTPSAVRMIHGHAYLLRLVNDSDRGHNFVSKQFFAAAAVDPAARPQIEHGGVEVPKHGAVELRLTAPVAGHYKLNCTHFTHSMRGMTGEIIVE